MLPADLFRTKTAVEGARVRLEPLTVDVLADYLPGLDDPEISRLTGTTETFSPAQVESWLRTRAYQPDRMDWAVVRSTDSRFLGEVALNDFDPANACVGFRIWLLPEVLSQGYGSEASRLAVDYAFERGLHRVELEVYDFNPRAQRAYEKCGFRVEGRRREALLWDGEWHDVITMAVLATDPVFLQQLGLIEALSTNRGNGIASMARRIREAAQACAAPA